jgi:integrase/recombinase XerC
MNHRPTKNSLVIHLLVNKETLMQLLQKFQDYLTLQDRSPATVRGYITDLNVFSRWLRRDLSTLGPNDVREYRSVLLKSGAAAQTVNRKLAAIAAFGSWAVQAGVLASNPALSVKSVENVQLAPKWLDKKERSDFVQSLKDDLQKSKLRYPRLWVLRLRDAAVIMLLINTGLRVSEVANLRISDILMTERKANLTVRAGKGRKQRQVPINTEARRLLDEWLSVRPDSGSEMLFIGQRGEPMQVRSVQIAVMRIAEQAGLKDVTPHILRHTFAKSLLDNGVSLEKVATLLGHESLDTTRIYVTPGERDLEEAVAGLVE